MRAGEAKGAGATRIICGSTAWRRNNKEHERRYGMRKGEQLDTRAQALESIMAAEEQNEPDASTIETMSTRQTQAFSTHKFSEKKVYKLMMGLSDNKSAPKTKKNITKSTDLSCSFLHVCLFQFFHVLRFSHCSCSIFTFLSGSKIDFAQQKSLKSKTSLWHCQTEFRFRSPVSPVSSFQFFRMFLMIQFVSSCCLCMLLMHFFSFHFFMFVPL